jgi:hypothetical protein
MCVCVCVCVECARKDSVIHRLTTCETSVEIWSWTRIRVAMLMRTLIHSQTAAEIFRIFCYGLGRSVMR